MAADLHKENIAPWIYGAHRNYSDSPSAASTKSSSSSDSYSALSVDEPSAQSSVSSTSIGWSNVHYENEDPRWGQPASEAYYHVRYIPNGNTCSYKSQTSPLPQPHTKCVAPEARQNPRRTQRLNSSESQEGNFASQFLRPPPPLVRQSERKVNFVDSLVGELM